MSGKSNDIYIQNARVHNLKNLSVHFKRNQLTVVTGVSGSGKSSLVFDTLYAEGQRRYVESLSAYARQFMGRMNKPDVDFIRGISPAIAIEQKVNIRNPRSTVATSTELYDYLKLLFARTGKTFSPESHTEVRMHQVADVIHAINSLEEGTRVLLLVAIDGGNKRTFEEELKILLQKGFSRLRITEEIHEIEALCRDTETLKQYKKTFPEKCFLIIDRFTVQPDDEDMRNRMADSIQTAFAEGNGTCNVSVVGEHSHEWHFSNKFEADGIKFEIPSLHFFTFNNPYGACKTCEGYGSIIGISEALVIPNPRLSIYEDAVLPWRSEKMSAWKDHFIKISRKNEFPIHRAYHELTNAQKDYLWHGGAGWEGIDGFFADLESQSYKIQYRVMLSRYRGRKTCPDCKGTRLRKDSSYVLLTDEQYQRSQKGNPFEKYKSLQEIILMDIDSALGYFKQYEPSKHDSAVADRILKEIRSRLQCLADVGLGYLSLNRLSNTLSGGESQRINLATSLGSSLVGSMYILDEPSIGLHSRDTQRLIKVLKNLRDLGNTVIVVEHDEEIMEVADEIADIGPLAGSSGGHLVAQGTLKEIKNHKESLTGKYLSGKNEIRLPTKRRKFTHSIKLTGAAENNLQQVNVEIPLNVMTVVTGVSGSGKTTLVKKVLYPALLKEKGLLHGETAGIYEKIGGDIKKIQQIELIDQNPIGKSSRSNPVTYVKAYDGIRDLYASQPLSKNRGYKSSHFSFNVEGGRCETCQGEGETVIEMQFMADIKLVCEDCGGSRFKSEIQDVTYKEKNIGQLLEMTVEEAMEFFGEQTAIINKLKPLADVGLGYVKLGQSASTLSGGEAQRVKLATFLGKTGQSSSILFIFDEPTTGLHFHDINKLLQSFQALIDHGHTVLIIEHNLEVVKCADWVIDMGPEGGNGGGQVVFAGTPEALCERKDSHTAAYLNNKIKQK